MNTRWSFYVIIYRNMNKRLWKKREIQHQIPCKIQNYILFKQSHSIKAWKFESHIYYFLFRQTMYYVYIDRNVLHVKL
jgi:hypothetical protein